MDNKLVLAITVAVLMVGSAFALAGAGASSAAPIAKGMGNYTFSYYSNNGTIVNLNYSGEEQSANVASIITVSGANLSIPFMSGGDNVMSDMSAFNLANETLMLSMDSNAMLILSQPAYIGGNVKETVVFPASVTELSSQANVTSFGGLLSNISVQSGMGVSSHFSIYRIGNSSLNMYFVSNAATQSLVGNTLTLNTSMGTNSILASGFVVVGSIEKTIQRYYEDNNFGNSFSYNQTTGAVTGRFVNFDFNNATGVISNFAVNGTMLMTIFNTISASGHGSIGSESDFSAFQTGIPMVFGSMFFYANSSYTYAVHNNPAIEFSMMLDNGTMNLAVSSSLNVTNVSSSIGMGDEFQVNASQISSNVSEDENITLGMDNEFHHGQFMYILQNSSFRGILDISGASVMYSKATHSFSVTTNGTAMVHFVSPEGFRDIPGIFFGSIENAIQQGKIAAQMSIVALNHSAFNYTMFFNNSVGMKVTGITSGRISVALTSSEHLGTNLLFFVNQSFLNSGGKIYVYLDGKLATLTPTVNGTLTITSDTAAYYAYEQVSGGYLVIVHVPHFSDHTVTISDSLLSPTSGPVSLSPLDIGIIAVAIVAVIAGIVVAVRRR